MKTPSPEQQAFEYLQHTYGPHVQKGARIECTTSSQLRLGVVTGAKGQYIKIRFDGELKPDNGVYHPTSNIRYLP